MRCTALLLLITACESGTGARLDITVPDEVASAFDAAAPGVLRADFNGFVTSVVTVCGPLEENPVRHFEDFGFGCVGDKEGTSEPVRAWIEPVSEEAALCDSIPGNDESFATEPDPAWAQGESTTTWRRDFSPCGGVAEGEVTVE